MEIPPAVEPPRRGRGVMIASAALAVVVSALVLIPLKPSPTEALSVPVTAPVETIRPAEVGRPREKDPPPAQAEKELACPNELCDLHEQPQDGAFCERCYRRLVAR